MSTKNLSMPNGYEWRKPPKDVEFHYIINEVKYVEEFMDKVELAYDDDIGATISLLARYYRNYKGLPKVVCEDLIWDYLDKYHLKKFDVPVTSGVYATAIAYACSTKHDPRCHGYKPLRDFDGIYITQKEIDCIKQLESLKEQELLFAILCFTKMYDETNRRQGRKVNHLFYVSNSVLRRSVGWKKTETEDVNTYIGSLADKEYLSFIKNSNKYDFLYLNLQPIYTNQCAIVDDEGDGVFYVDNFDTLALTWQYILGNKKIKRCQCGRYFERTSNRQIMCPKCGYTGVHKKSTRLKTNNGKKAMRKQRDVK